jgi:hypothetical protein
MSLVETQAQETAFTYNIFPNGACGGRVRHGDRARGSEAAHLRGRERSENDGRFIPLCPLDAGLSDRDRLGHRSIGLVIE